MMQLTEEQRKALSGLCKIEIKRWNAASESNPNMRYMVELMEIALDELDQPPVSAPVVPDFSECPLCDSNYISGMQAGYKFGAEQDREGFNAAVEHYRKEMRGSRALRLNATAPAEGKE